MEKKVRIPKEKIIAINTRFVYFLENGKVFKGTRKIGRTREGLGCNESSRSLFVIEKSIKKIEGVFRTQDTKLLKILQIHGVKIIK